MYMYMCTYMYMYMYMWIEDALYADSFHFPSIYAVRTYIV